MLQDSGSLEDSGHIVWQLALALIVAWIIVFLMLVRGIKVCLLSL